jgi:F-type H+-transporting ATPase subunit delta
MSDSPAALVYARALLQAAGDSAVQVADELDSLAQLGADQPEQWEALIAPAVTSEQRKAALAQVFKGGSAITRNFLFVLVDRGRLEDLPSIASNYRQLVQAQQNQLDVHVTTAVDLSADLRSKLEERLSSSTGKTVKLHTSVDPSIIGGLIVHHGDTLVDTSLRGRLESLRLTLQRGRLATPGAE